MVRLNLVLCKATCVGCLLSIWLIFDAVQAQIPQEEPPRNEKPHLKGVWLYSTYDQKERQWIFGYLPGTNNGKTAKQVKDALKIKGTRSLKRQLARLAPGERILWIENDSPLKPNGVQLKLPDQMILKDLKDFCKSQEITLEVPENDKGGELMQTSLWILVTCLCPIECHLSESELAAPRDLPPLFATAIAQPVPDRPSAVQLKITYSAMTAENRGRMIPKRSWPTTHVETQQREMKVTLDPRSPSQLQGTQVVSIDGKPVDRDTLLKRLDKATAVLVSPTGRSIDPYYLQVVKDDTLIIELGPRDGAPDLSGFPRIEQEN